MPTLTIIIINYNGAAFIADCLASVMAQSSFFPDFNVIVFDNASTDTSIDIIKSFDAPNVSLIQHPENVGFPQAHNILLPQLTAPYLWLLNNDTCFNHDTDIITPIIDHFKTDPDIVGISPRLLNTDGSLQVQGGGLSTWRFHRKTPVQVPFLSGASLFMVTDFFRHIGGFDPNLFFYNDDVDFAHQVKKHGKKLVYYPLVSVTHHGGLSTKFNRMDTKIAGYIGSLYLCKKYYSPVIFLLYRGIIKALIYLYRLNCKRSYSTHPDDYHQLTDALERINREF